MAAARSQPSRSSLTLPESTVDPRTHEARLAPLLVSIERAAELLSVSRTRMFELLADPETRIRTIRLGKLRRVVVESLEAEVARLEATDAGS